jgi:hypothetical protein
MRVKRRGRRYEMIRLRQVERASLGMGGPLAKGEMTESGNVRASRDTIVIWTAWTVENFWVILMILS